MPFGFELVGMAEFEAALVRVAAGADHAAREIVERSGALVEAEAKAGFQGAHRRGMPHVGGDAPNIVSGTARRSIRSDPAVRIGLATYTLKVGPTVIYGRRLELGYRGSRGYPYFGPGVARATPKFQAIAAESWRAFVVGAA